MTTETAYLLEKETPLVTEDLIREAALAAAKPAAVLADKKGGGNQAAINQIACGALADGIHENFNLTLISKMSEGRRGGHPRFADGLVLTKPTASPQRAWVISDAVENEANFCRTGPRSRPSMVLLAVAPEGSLPKVDSALPARALVVPFGAPVGPGQIEIDSEPELIVQKLGAQFRCQPEDIHVTILKRSWTETLVEKFRGAGATIHLIMAGDFQAFIEAAEPVKPGSPVHVAAGIGGLVEAYLSIPYLKSLGAHMLLQVVPPGMEMNADQIQGMVYDKDTMLPTDDCLLAVAGLTEADVPPGDCGRRRFLVPGVRKSPATGTTWVSVMVASPKLERCRHYVVEYPAGTGPALTLLEEQESLNEHLLERYFRLGQAMETRVAETRQGDRHYFQHWSGSFVPGLEALSEHELIDVLFKLEGRSRIRGRIQVHAWDTSEYTLKWSCV